MLLAGGLGGIHPAWNLIVQLTLFQPGGADYAHHITACTPGFENISTPLHVLIQSIQNSVSGLVLDCFNTPEIRLKFLNTIQHL